MSFSDKFKAAIKFTKEASDPSDLYTDKQKQKMKQIKKPQKCVTCGFIGKPVKITPGNQAMELGLWIFTCGIIGVLYSLWRLCNRQPHCPMCKASMVHTEEQPTELHIEQAKQPNYKDKGSLVIVLMVVFIILFVIPVIVMKLLGIAP